MQESVIKIASVVDRMIARCDEIAACAQGRGKQARNIFMPREARKTADLCLSFVAAIAGASSMAAVVASAPALEALALAKIAHHMALPLRQIFHLCSQKLHEQLTVGC